MARIYCKSRQRHGNKRCSSRQEIDRDILHRPRINEQTHAQCSKHIKALCLHDHSESHSKHNISRHYRDRSDKRKLHWMFYFSHYFIRSEQKSVLLFINLFLLLAKAYSCTPPHRYRAYHQIILGLSYKCKRRIENPSVRQLFHLF